MAQKIIDAKGRETAWCIDALLPDQRFSAAEVGDSEKHVGAAENSSLDADSRFRAGAVTHAKVYQTKAEVSFAKGRLAWAQGDLLKCQREFDDAVGFWQLHALIVSDQREIGLATDSQAADVETKITETRILASRVKRKIVSKGLKLPPPAHVRAELRTVKLPSGIRDLAYSPDKKRIVGAVFRFEPGFTATVKVWDATSGRELLALDGSFAGVRGFGYGTDGTRIVGGVSGPFPGMSTTVKVWDATSGRELLTLDGSFLVLWGLACSPDGMRIVGGVSGGDLGPVPNANPTVKVWGTQSAAMN